MIISNNMRSVIMRLDKMIRNHQLDIDDISPNTVAIVADGMGIGLTSEQIVYISDNI